MKKRILSITALALLFTSLIFLFGCTKNENTNIPNKIDPVKSSDLNVGADSLNSDTNQKARSKAVNEVSCAVSKTFASPFASNYYTVIGYFPQVGSPSIVVPKGSWRAGPYAFNNQGDGNLVLYVYATGKVLWSSNTQQKSTRLDLQNDLNMVLYPVNGGPVVFESQTYFYKCGSKNPRNTKLVLTVDGNLCIIADGMATFGPVTVTLGTTRTFGGVPSPNDHTFFKLYTTSHGTGGVSFVY